MNDRIIAQVILAPGASQEATTAENIERVRAPAQQVSDARRRLEERGFSVVQEGPTSLSIEGTRAQFERVFDTHIETPISASAALRVPADLRDIVSEVVLPTPPELFP
jgi:hypothetical protein